MRRGHDTGVPGATTPERPALGTGEAGMDCRGSNLGS